MTNTAQHLCHTCAHSDSYGQPDCNGTMRINCGDEKKLWEPLNPAVRVEQKQGNRAKDGSTWSAYVAGMVCHYLGKPLDFKEEQAIAGIIERRLWALPAPAQAQQAQEPLTWIPVTERLPAVCAMVLCFCKNDSCADTAVYQGSGKWAFGDVADQYWDEVQNPVTHWMPLPAAPAPKQAITPETGNATPPEASAITSGNGQQAQEPVPPEQIEEAWRAGWAACRDAEYVGQEAEDEAWGMSETCANADWENAAPKQAEPEGWKLVPVEPTQEMIAAVGVGGSGVYERLVWKQMLSATRGTP